MATSLCETHCDFIEAQLRLKRKATAIFQDLVNQHGFAVLCNAGTRFVVDTYRPGQLRFGGHVGS